MRNSQEKVVLTQYHNIIMKYDGLKKYDERGNSSLGGPVTQTCQKGSTMFNALKESRCWL